MKGAGFDRDALQDPSIHLAIDTRRVASTGRLFYAGERWTVTDTPTRLRESVWSVDPDELLFVLERQWRKLGKTLDPDDFTDAQAIAAVERITRGNFRLLERLLPQIQRVLKINELDVITNDVVEAARSTLVIGTT